MDIHTKHNHNGLPIASWWVRGLCRSCMVFWSHDLPPSLSFSLSLVTFLHTLLVMIVLSELFQLIYYIWIRLLLWKIRFKKESLSSDTLEQWIMRAKHISLLYIEQIYQQIYHFIFYFQIKCSKGWENVLVLFLFFETNCVNRCNATTL